MADLTVTITEHIVLNNVNQGGYNQLTVTGINDIYKRMVTIPSGGDATIAVFKSSTDAGDAAVDLNNVKYIRITNKGSNNVNLSLQIDNDEDNSAANTMATILLEPSKSFMLGAADETMIVHDSSATIVTALSDLESIIADSGSNAALVEVFVATT
jgi:hypothetical protein